MRRIWIFTAGGLLLLIELSVLAARVSACELEPPAPRLESLLMLHDVRLLLELEAEVPGVSPAEPAAADPSRGR